MASPSPSPSPDAPPPGMTAQYVKAWGEWSLPLELTPGQTAMWEWRTQAHDLQFSATFHPHAAAAEAHHAHASGSKKKKKHSHKHSKSTEHTVVHALTRVVKADQLLQHGSFTAPADGAGGTLTLLFDNTYSKMRGKNLLYKLSVLGGASGSGAGNATAAIVPFGEVRMTPLGPAVVEGMREDAETGAQIYTVSLPFGAGYFNAATLLSSRALPSTVNQRCLVGVEMFFNNRYEEAEAFFSKDVEKYPQFSLAYGSLGFLRALMTWDKGDIASANARLKQTRNFVSALLPSESALSSMGRFLSRSSGPALTPQQLELTLLQGESYLLQAMLLFTEESYMSYVKAGLRIRSAWKAYEKCAAALDSYDQATLAQVDPGVVGGVQFGTGTFNVVISTLPSIVLRLVSALGFPSDRKRGLELLGACASKPGIRQALSSLMLLFHHVIIPSFLTVRPAFHAAEARKILDAAFQRYPRGALFLWEEGRLLRMGRDLPLASRSFARAAAGQPGWLQLQHLCAYELGWCSFFSLDFPRAGECWARLARENSWSKAFFVYMHAVCVLSGDNPAGVGMVSGGGDEAAAQELMAQVEPSITRKFGGKVMGVEQFVSRRAGQFLARSAATPSGAPVLPALELAYLFYGLVQMSDPLLERCLAQVDLTLATAGPGQLGPEERALALVLKATVLKGLRRWNAARLILQQLDYALHAAGGDTPAGEIDPASYVPAFARFELATLLMEQVQEKDEAMARGASAASAAAGAPARPASVDEPMPADAGPGSAAPGSPAAVGAAARFASQVPLPSSSSSSPVPWESQRLALLDGAWHLLKKAEGMKATCFTTRLHLRIHLACVEVTMMRRHWEDIQGNVQAESDMTGPPVGEGGELVDSDQEDA